VNIKWGLLLLLRNIGLESADQLTFFFSPLIYLFVFVEEKGYAALHVSFAIVFLLFNLSINHLYKTTVFFNFLHFCFCFFFLFFIRVIVICYLSLFLPPFLLLHGFLPRNANQAKKGSIFDLRHDNSKVGCV
jgi:hypothetical protein